MNYDAGRVNFRLYYLTKEYDSSLVEDFARYVCPPVVDIKSDPIQGWVTGKHLLDRNISDERCVIGPYIHVHWLKAEKKIPSSYLKANIKLEEEVEMKARQINRLPRKVKAEVKQRVIAALQPQMPPSLNGIPCVVDLRNNRLICGAMSDAQMDAFGSAFKETADSVPIAITPDTAALKRKQINARDLDPVLFTKDETVEPPHEGSLGMDFLTWLWFNWDTGSATFHLPDGRECGYMVEGPITFFSEGQGAHEAVLRKGMPLDSREASTALICGKKLSRAKFIFAVDEKVTEASVDSDFCFRSVKLPKEEQEEAEGIFEERMMAIETFTDGWFKLYDHFLDLRTDPDQWQKTLEKMQDWIQHIGNARHELDERP